MMHGSHRPCSKCFGTDVVVSIILVEKMFFFHLLRPSHTPFPNIPNGLNIHKKRKITNEKSILILNKIFVKMQNLLLNNEDEEEEEIVDKWQLLYDYCMDYH